jgi:hypothetical protein
MNTTSTRPVAVRTVHAEGSYSIEESDRGTYRFRCATCNHTGRWLANGNTAKAYGENHADRHNGRTNW